MSLTYPEGFAKLIPGNITAVTVHAPVTLDSAVNRPSASVYDAASGNIVVAYSINGSGETQFVVGVVTGTTITFGTPNTQVFQGNLVELVYDSVNEKTVAFIENSTIDEGVAMVGTVTGDAISFGTQTAFSGGYGIDAMSIAFDAGIGKFVVMYYETSLANLRGTVGTVSGTSISFGTITTTGENTINYFGVDMDGTGYGLVAFRGNFGHAYAYPITVTGTDISFGTRNTFDTSSTTSYEVVYDPTQARYAVFCEISNNGVYFIIRAETGSIISATVGAVQWTNDQPLQIRGTYDATLGRIILVWNNSASNGPINMTSCEMTTVGQLTFAAPAQIASGSNNRPYLSYYPPGEKYLATYIDITASNDLIMNLVSAPSETLVESLWTCSFKYADESSTDGYSFSDKEFTYGSSTNIINANLTAEDINNPEFGVVFDATSYGESGTKVKVDAIKVRVTYRAANIPGTKEARRPSSLSSIVVFGNRFVAVGAGGRVITSDDDGANWVERTSGVLEDVWQIRQIANLLYAVGDNGLIMTSTDGETWIRKTSGTRVSLRNIAAFGLVAVISGRDDIGLYSREADTWSRT